MRGTSVFFAGHCDEPALLWASAHRHDSRQYRRPSVAPWRRNAMILCCGEALIDMLPATSDAGAPCFRPHSGGAVFNTSVALARLGAPTGLLTGLSEDLFGAQLARTLE